MCVLCVCADATKLGCTPKGALDPTHTQHFLPLIHATITIILYPDTNERTHDIFSISQLFFCFVWDTACCADDSVGFWHVTKHPTTEKKDDWSRVYYSVQLRIPSWVPGIVIGYLNKKAIREVCGVQQLIFSRVYLSPVPCRLSHALPPVQGFHQQRQQKVASHTCCAYTLLSI